jgi:hypothetical protein
MATKKKTDLSAALTGLILGAVTIFLLLTSIVMITNARYRDKEKAEAAAATPPPAAPTHP